MPRTRVMVHPHLLPLLPLWQDWVVVEPQEAGVLALQRQQASVGAPVGTRVCRAGQGWGLGGR